LLKERRGYLSPFLSRDEDVERVIDAVSDIIAKNKR